MENAPPPTAIRINRWLWVMLLVAVVGAVFWPVLTFDFVRWDDDINVTQNPMMIAPWSWSLAGQFFESSTALRFKPLHWLVFRIVAGWFDFNPVAWHGLNLVLHVAAGVLAFLVMRQVFALAGAAPDSLATNAWACAGAAWWALHPLRAEPVAWVTASTYPLTAVCLLGSFQAYLGAHRKTGVAPERCRLAVAWLLAVAAYASYPIGAAYGLWLIAVDKCLLKIAPDRWLVLADPKTHRWWGKQALFLAPAVVALGFTVWSRITNPGIFVEAPSLLSVDMGSRLWMALAALAYFPLRLFWPTGLTPNMPPLQGGVLGNWHVPLLALTAVMALLLMWRKRRAHPGLALVCFGFAILSLPCLGLTERPDWPVDRYSYLVDLIIIGGLAGGGLAWSKGGRRKFAQVGGLAVMAGLLACAVLARRQIAIWRDTDSLFSHMEQAPGFADNPVQEGYIYFLWGRHAAISAQPVRATRFFSQSQRVYRAAVEAAIKQGDYEGALKTLSHLEGRFGLTPELRREKGAWLLRVSRPEEALRELRAAGESLRDDARARALIDEAERALDADRSRGGGEQAAGLAEPH